MQVNNDNSEPIKAEFYSVSGGLRNRRGNYQIFSLKKDEPLVEEMRAVLSKLGIEWNEHDLPGVTGPEIGFMFPRAQWQLFPYDEELVSDALSSQVHAWLSRPAVDPLPEYVFLPEDCRIDVIANIKKFLAVPDIIPGDFGNEWGQRTPT